MWSVLRDSSLVAWFYLLLAAAAALSVAGLAPSPTLRGQAVFVAFATSLVAWGLLMLTRVVARFDKDDGR